MIDGTADGGPAFPGRLDSLPPAMSLREYIAVQVTAAINSSQARLEAICETAGKRGVSWEELAAKLAVRQADALLQELDPPG